MGRIDHRCYPNFAPLLLALAGFLLLPTSGAFADVDHTTRITDVDGDGHGEIILHDPTTATFQVKNIQKKTVSNYQLGDLGDIPATGDFNGDGYADLATYNPSRARWEIRSGQTGNVSTFREGLRGGIPVPGFYRQTECTETATYFSHDAEYQIGNCRKTGYQKDKPEIGTSYRFRNRDGAVAVPADYDCDGYTDRAIFDRRTNEWVIKRSANGKLNTVEFGEFGDIPSPGNYEDANCAEIAVYRPSTNQLLIRDRETGEIAETRDLGSNGDQPLTINTDGGAAEFAVFRPENFNVYTKTATDKVKRFTFQALAPAISKRTAPPVSALSVSGFFGGIGGTLGSIFSGFSNGLPSGGGVGGVDLSGIDFTQINEQLPFEVMSDVRQEPVSNFGPVKTRILGDFARTQGADLVTIRTVQGELVWSIRHGDGTSSLYRFGLADDQVIAADYNGDQRSDPGVVREEAGNLVWYTRKSSGDMKTTYFGLSGDRAITGDFDCDGKNDFAVVRPGVDGLLYWYMNPSTSSSGDVRVTQFGLALDRVYSADVRGLGCDQYVVAQVHDGLMYWFIYDPVGQRQWGPYQWGLDGDFPLTPADFTGDGAADILVTRDVAGAKNLFGRSVYSKGNVGVPDVYSIFGFASDVSVPGFFSGVNRAEFAVYRRGGLNEASHFYILRHTGFTDDIPFGTDRDRVVGPDGIVGGFDQLAQREFANCSFPSFPDGGGGNLWKPNREGGSGSGEPTFLGSSSLGQVEVFGSDGTRINVPLRYQYGNGGRSVWDVPWSRAALRSIAPLRLKLTYFSGACEVLSVPDPYSRID